MVRLDSIFYGCIWYTKQLVVIRTLQLSQRNGKLPLPRWKQVDYPKNPIFASTIMHHDISSHMLSKPFASQHTSPSRSDLTLLHHSFTMPSQTLFFKKLTKLFFADFLIQPSQPLFFKQWLESFCVISGLLYVTPFLLCPYMQNSFYLFLSLLSKHTITAQWS